jgi:uncharacterized protein YjbI with pentapeptide repeats
MSMNRNLRSLVEAKMMKPSWARGVRVKNADFQNAELAGADFEGADLTNSNFESASFNGSGFDQADFGGADLDGADFSNAKNLDKAYWPDGYRLVKE